MSEPISIPTNWRFQDLRGRVFGRWTVIEFAGRGRDGLLSWLCRCDCGVTQTIRTASLTTGNSTSCGCAAREKTRVRNRSHGETVGYRPSREYRCWQLVKRRCYAEKCRDYPDYGGRGVRVCERWLGQDGFNNFLQDMGRKPTPRHSIGRKDNNGDYTPDNCRWETPKQQARNRRSSRLLTCNGETKTMAEWGEILGVPTPTICKRLKNGLSVAQALGLD